MARRCGVRDGRVVLVAKNADDIVDVDGMTLVAVPAHLLHLSDAELLENVVLRDGDLRDARQPRPRKQLRIAMVGAWGIPCGIATYAEALWPAIGARVGDWLVFAEENDGVEDGPNVKAGLWKRGKPMGALAEALLDWKPDAVMIQHEYGLFPDARHWLSLMTRIRDLRPVTTLHSVYRHEDKGICEAACPEIVVHSDMAKAVLREKGIQHAPIHVIAHGCGPLAVKKLYNLYRTPHRFMQFGFGFRYKNWEASIGAVALLKRELPDIFFTGLFSEGMFSKAEHDRYHAELMALAKELGVLENIALIRGFQSEASLDSFLGTNAAACFPYKNDPDHVVYGASGAARRAMQSGVPVIVSGVPHFADLGDVCPKAETAEEVAAAVKLLLTDASARARALSAQAVFLYAHSWARMAVHYTALL